MARPVKATVDYFPHDTNHGKTLYIIEQLYGNDGYCFWFKLLEQLGNLKHHYFDMQDHNEFEFFIAKCRITKEKALDILNKLSELGAIDTELFKEDIIFSENFVNNVKDAYCKRVVECWLKKDLLQHLHTSERVSANGNPIKGNGKPQRKEEYSKEEERIVEVENFHGEYSNVYLTKENKLRIDALTTSDKLTKELIENLDENIGCGKEEPYKEELPDAHFIRLKAYFKYRKQNPKSATEAKSILDGLDFGEE